MPAPKPGSPAYLKREQQRNDLVIWCENLYAYKLAARAVGIDEDTFKKWRNADQELSDAVEQARTRFLNKQVRKAKPEFLLERLEPEHFKQRMDVTSGDQPMTTALVEFVVPKGKK